MDNKITRDQFREILEDYSAVFPDHPGFNMLTLSENSTPFRNAYQQMLECLMGERTEPVTDESIGLGPLPPGALY